LGGGGGSRPSKFRFWVKNGKLRISQAGFLLGGGGKTGGGRPGQGDRGGWGGYNKKTTKNDDFRGVQQGSNKE